MTGLLDVMVPVVLVAGCGFFVGRAIRHEATVWAKILFYVLGPALVFRSIYTSAVTLESAVTVVAVAAAMHAVMAILSWGVGRGLGWDDDTQATGSLVLTFPNCANYGLPVLLFAYGEQGFALGMVFVLASLLIQGTLGIGIASWHKGTPWVRSLGNAIRAPYVYAFLLALLLRVPASVELPISIYRGVDLLADAAIPGQLLMLGFQLARVRIQHLRELGGTAVLLSAIKLTIPPLLVWGLTLVLGIGGLVRAVLVIEAGMPSAVNSIVLTANYHRNNELAASTVMISTLLSLVTVSLLLQWL